MAIIKILVMNFLLMFCSLATFGQDVIDFGTVPKGSDEGRAFSQPKNKNLPIENDRKVIIDIQTDVSPNFDQADPRMPIMALPKDSNSNFPLKKLPKDFPSDMPIYGPKEKSPDLMGRNHSIKPRH